MDKPFLNTLNKIVNRPKVIFVTTGVLIGLGFGIFFRDILLWKRKEEGYLRKVHEQLFEVKSELRTISITLEKLANVQKKNIISENFITQESESDDDTDSFYSFNEDNDLDDFVKEIDQTLSDGLKDSYLRCYELCHSLVWKYQEFSDFLWRFAMISYRSTLVHEFSEEERRERISAAANNAQLAVKRSPRCSESRKWHAILLGVTGLLADIKTKISNGKKFKEQIDKCLEINPNDAYACLLKGRFCYQVSNLAFYERKLAALLFETPPTATIQEALECFQKCENLAPKRYAENHYYLHLCYRSLSDYYQSEQWLSSAKTIPIEDYEVEFKLKISNS